MATSVRTVLSRYNGVDWDSVFLATAGDVVQHGKGFTVSNDATGFNIDDVVEITDDISDLLTKTINRLATLDKVEVAALKSGSGITSLDASKITGVISRDNLPSDVGGKGIPVTSEEAKDALTKEQVNIGDIVKVDAGAMYLVKNITADGTIEYMKLSDDTAQIAWSRVTGTPTTLTGYGITDAVGTADLAKKGGDTAANKVAQANAAGKLDFDILGDAATLGGNAPEYFATKTALDTTNTNVTTNATDITQLKADIKAIDASWITKGMLSMNVIPKGAVPNMYIASGEDQLPLLTTAQVQNGDTVKIADTETKVGEMYYVADETKLGTADWADAYVKYSAGTASAVNWSGVLKTPTTLAGYGITDAVASSMLSETAVAGKILLVNADGKLAADITGDAATLGGKAAALYALKSDLENASADVTEISGKVNTLTEIVNGKAAEGENPAVPGLVSRVTTLEGAVGDADTAGTILYDIPKIKSGEAITALAASKITGTMTRAQLPADIGGRLIEKTDMTTVKAECTIANTAVGDLIKLDNGQVWIVVSTTDLTADASYKLIVDVAATSIAWSKITGTPTTLAGYGITDAVNTADVIVDALADGADVGGKLVKVNSTDKKMHVNIAGDAMTLAGNAPAYFATKAALDALAIQVPIMVNSVDELENPALGQMVLLPVSTT